MIAGPGKNDAVVLRSGVGRVRARTISIGSHVIAIDNIGTIRVVPGHRSWWLLLLGALIIAGGGVGTQFGDYVVVAAAGIGVGVVLALASLFRPIESALLVGTSDGRATLIVSRDIGFLQRLQQALVDRIDTGDEGFSADFDPVRGTIVRATARAAGSDDARGAGRSPDPTVTSANSARAVAFSTEPGLRNAPETGDDAEDALFADPEPASPETSSVETKAGPATLAASSTPHLSVGSTVQAERRKPFDPLLDGRAKRTSRDDEWLAPQTPSASSPPAQSEGRIARALLGLLIVGLLGSGVFAAWYFTGENGPVTSISTIEVPDAPVAEGPADTSGSLTQGAGDPQAPVVTSISAEPSPAAAPAPAPEVDPNLAAESESEVEDFAPASPMVTRASGHRYRASPSTAADVAVLAETRAGGEELNITARLKRPDGDWYRVELPDQRMAWFKASLAVPRASFADTVGPAGAGPDASFAGSVPQILEPSEGIQFDGGPQSVRLAWSHRDDAALYIIEIQTFDSQTQRWIEDPLHKRVTVEAATELADTFPFAGNWRWRVRGVTADGQQSQFSRWSAFSIRN